MTIAVPDDPEVTRRDLRLRQRIADLAGRVGAGDLDRRLQAAGPVLLVFGFALLWLGWYGASNTSRVYFQIPYLISGGLAGLGLVFSGGFLFFSRFVVDLIRQSAEQAAEAKAVADETLAALHRIEVALAAGAGPATAPVAGGPASPSLVMTTRGSMAHRPDCPLVAGRQTRPVPADADPPPCQVCLGDEDGGGEA